MIRLTITARDTRHAQKILAAIERVDAEGTILVGPNDEPPTGHTYRELVDARRSGLLEAEMTPKGLVFTEAALEAYRAGKAERRRRPKAKAANVTDLTEHRVKALEAAGFHPGGGRR